MSDTVTLMSDGAPTEQFEGGVPAEELEALAEQLGVKKRTLEQWRRRELVPSPRRVGFDGKRPLWVYTAGAKKQLAQVVRLRKQTRDLEAILVALWASGFDVSVDAVRAALLMELDRYEEALERDVRSSVGVDSGLDELRRDPDAMRTVAERYAGDVARRRSRNPMGHTVRMTLAERQRGWLYVLAPLFDQSRDEADAVFAERALGLARGRSRDAQGLLELTPSEHLATSPLTPDALRSAVIAADTPTYLFVAAALNSFLKLTPLLATILLPDNSTLRSFSDQVTDLFRNPPPEFVVLLAAVIIRNTHERRAHHELTPALIDSLELNNLAPAILSMLTPDQRERLTGMTRKK
jgi:DNA-binding transcriptional MerR regulator